MSTATPALTADEQKVLDNLAPPWKKREYKSAPPAVQKVKLAALIASWGDLKNKDIVKLAAQTQLSANQEAVLEGLRTQPTGTTGGTAESPTYERIAKMTLDGQYKELQRLVEKWQPTAAHTNTSLMDIARREPSRTTTVLGSSIGTHSPFFDQAFVRMGDQLELHIRLDPMMEVIMQEALRVWELKYEVFYLNPPALRDILQGIQQKMAEDLNATTTAEHEKLGGELRQLLIELRSKYKHVGSIDPETFVSLVEAICITDRAMLDQVAHWWATARLVQTRSMLDNITAERAQLRANLSAARGVPSSAFLAQFQEEEKATSDELKQKAEDAAESLLDLHSKHQALGNNMTNSAQKDWDALQMRCMEYLMYSDRDVLLAIVQRDENVKADGKVATLFAADWFKTGRLQNAVGGPPTAPSESMKFNGVELPQNVLTAVADKLAATFGSAASAPLADFVEVGDRRSVQQRTVDVTNGSKVWISVATKGANNNAHIVNALVVATGANPDVLDPHIVGPIARALEATTYVPAEYASLDEDDLSKLPAFKQEYHQLKLLQESICHVFSFDDKEARKWLQKKTAARGAGIASYNDSVVDELQPRLQRVTSFNRSGVMELFKDAEIGYLLSLVYTYARLRAALGAFGLAESANDATVMPLLTSLTTFHRNKYADIGEAKDKKDRKSTRGTYAKIGIVADAVAFAISNIINYKSVEDAIKNSITKKQKAGLLNNVLEFFGLAAGTTEAESIKLLLVEVMKDTFKKASDVAAYNADLPQSDIAVAVAISFSAIRPCKVTVDQRSRVIGLTNSVIPDSYIKYAEIQPQPLGVVFLVERESPLSALQSAKRSSLQGDNIELLVCVKTEIGRAPMPAPVSAASAAAGAAPLWSTSAAAAAATFGQAQWASAGDGRFVEQPIVKEVKVTFVPETRTSELRGLKMTNVDVLMIQFGLRAAVNLQTKASNMRNTWLRQLVFNQFLPQYKAYMSAILTATKEVDVANVAAMMTDGDQMRVVSAFLPQPLSSA